MLLTKRLAQFQWDLLAFYGMGWVVVLGFLLLGVDPQTIHIPALGWIATLCAIAKQLYRGWRE